MNNMKEYARKHRQDIKSENITKRQSRANFRDLLKSITPSGIKKYSENDLKNIMLDRFSKNRNAKIQINYFANRKDFEAYYDSKEYGAPYSWDTYKHIKDLIATGQYENIRNEYARANYIYALEEQGVNDDIIEALEKMDINKFMQVIYEDINPDKNNLKSSKLPTLGGYKYILAAEELEESEEAIIEAFGLNLNKKASEVKEVVKRNRDKALPTGDVDKLLEDIYLLQRTRIPKKRNVSKKEYKDYIIESSVNIGEDIYKSRARVVYEYANKIISKGTPIIETHYQDGSHKGWQIPFVGSTTGKNEQLVKDVIAVVNRHLISKGYNPIDI